MTRLLEPVVPGAYGQIPPDDIQAFTAVMSEPQVKVLRALRVGITRQNHIITVTGLTQSTASRALHDLATDGLVQKVAPHWKISKPWPEIRQGILERIDAHKAALDRVYRWLA